MRLVCPNCGAQYEVPADAIPASGRDVQCSACGHTWFEGPAAAGAPADGAEATEADLAWSDPADVPTVEDDEEEQDDLAAMSWEPEPAAAAAPAAAVHYEEDGEPEEPPLAAPRPVRSTVTPEIAEILREEAEREARARAEEEARAEAGRRAEADATEAAIEAALEAEEEREPAWTAPPVPPAPVPDPVWELTPDPAARAADPGAPDRERQRAEEARRRIARLRGEAAAAAAPAARRDRLPDIEEIDSSLRGGAARAGSGPAPASSAGRGFRLGFGGVLLAAAALALLYAYSPQITAAAPGTAAVLDPYARAIDGGRLWLDARMRGMVEDLGGTNATPPSSTAPASEAPEVQAEPPAAPGGTAEAGGG